MFCFFFGKFNVFLKSFKIKQGQIHGHQMRLPRHLLMRPLPRPPPSLTPSSLPITSLHLMQSPAVLIIKKTRFCAFEKKWVRDRPTDGRTEGHLDRPSYRDARTHLKKCTGSTLRRHEESTLVCCIDPSFFLPVIIPFPGTASRFIRCCFRLSWII